MFAESITVPINRHLAEHKTDSHLQVVVTYSWQYKQQDLGKHQAAVGQCRDRTQMLIRETFFSYTSCQNGSPSQVFIIKMSHLHRDSRNATSACSLADQEKEDSGILSLWSGLMIGLLKFQTERRERRVLLGAAFLEAGEMVAAGQA